MQEVLPASRKIIIRIFVFIIRIFVFMIRIFNFGMIAGGDGVGNLANRGGFAFSRRNG